jgi:energy-coupling factor transport system permease protein
VIHTPRASVLHAARATVTAAYGLALVVLALSFDGPLVLGALLVVVVAAAFLAGVGRPVVRAGLFALPLAVLIAIVNALVVREGLTVLVRFGELGPLGQVDITLEALAYGLLLGLRVTLVGMACALAAAAVDPDELLRAMRPLSFRSALTATLATRMVPVLTRDARRMHDARRCRPDGGGSGPAAGVALVRAVTTGALDRAVDVAATLELRGYASRREAPRGPRRPLSRHDIAVGCSAAGLVVLALAGGIAGLGHFEAYPGLDIGAGAGDIVFALAIVLVALLPFADRRGIAR